MYNLAKQSFLDSVNAIFQEDPSNVAPPAIDAKRGKLIWFN